MCACFVTTSASMAEGSNTDRLGIACKQTRPFYLRSVLQNTKIYIDDTRIWLVRESINIPATQGSHDFASNAEVLEACPAAHGVQRWLPLL